MTSTPVLLVAASAWLLRSDALLSPWVAVVASTSTVAVELEVADASVGDPAERLEGEVAGVTQHHQASQPGGGLVEAPFPAVRAESVGDDQMPVADLDLDSVAVRYVHPGVRVDVAGERRNRDIVSRACGRYLFRVPRPRTVTAVAGAVC